MKPGLDDEEDFIENALEMKEEIDESVEEEEIEE